MPVYRHIRHAVTCRCNIYTHTIQHIMSKHMYEYNLNVCWCILCGYSFLYMFIHFFIRLPVSLYLGVYGYIHYSDMSLHVQYVYRQAYIYIWRVSIYVSFRYSQIYVYTWYLQQHVPVCLYMFAMNLCMCCDYISVHIFRYAR